jgi:LDH2 family malate/lactate/ureidoglycolate dehydrogenase
MTPHPWHLISAQESKELVTRVFSSPGMPTVHAEQGADVLAWADLSGHSSHGGSRVIAT